MRRAAWWLGLVGWVLLGACAEEPICDPGTAGCACLSDATCRLDELTCVEGTCVSTDRACESGLCPPSEPLCFTPCSGDLVDADGTVRACSAEGLLRGCIGGQVCVQGTCVGATARGLSTPGSCDGDEACPEHQACIDGRCFSTCEDDGQCSADRTCFRTVCRLRCSDRTPCPAGWACGTRGVCLPLAEAQPDPEVIGEGSFELGVRWVELSKRQSTAEIPIRNLSTRSETLVIRKYEERIFNADGSSTTVRADEDASPLFWLAMGVGTARVVREVVVTVPPGSEVPLLVADAVHPREEIWRGVLEVTSETLGRETVELVYRGEITGRWSGTTHYFGNFESGPELETWRADRSDPSRLDAVPNAFLQAWGRFRSGRIGLPEMQALVQATLTGSWQFERVRELCREAGFGPTTACAPFGGTGSDAVIPYTSAVNLNRIPTGMVDLPLVLHLREAGPIDRADATGCGRSGLGSGDVCLVGRVETLQSLQYPNDPRVVVRLAAGAGECTSEGPAGCIVELDDFHVETGLGARFDVGPTEACGATRFELRSEPWLVPGFAAPRAEVGDDRFECRDRQQPFTSDPAASAAFARANPVGDGNVRRLRVELIDGILLEQSLMAVIFRELLDTFPGQPPAERYGYAVLRRDPVDLEPEAFRFNQPDMESSFEDAPRVSCSSSLINEVLRRPGRTIDRLTGEDRDRLARAMVTGATSSTAVQVLDPADAQVFSLCAFNEDRVVTSDGVPRTVSVARAVFEAGPDGVTACPVGSQVTYFALETADFGAGFSAHTLPCNQGDLETCDQQLRDWVYGGRGVRLMPRDASAFPDAPASTRFDLAFTCGAPGADRDPKITPEARAACEDDRFDLVANKSFYAIDRQDVVFNPVESEIYEAFRYRTQFESRSGRRTGFSPDLCADDDLEPYCYDPKRIAAVAERVDCALALWSFHDSAPAFDRLDPEVRDLLVGFLVRNFGVLQQDNPFGDPTLQQGFERLFAELLITEGDDAYVSSLQARYDFAGTRQLAFPGDAFEPGGVQVSGGAGYELYKLHEAVQSYELVLDRFFRLLPILRQNVEGPIPERFITSETLTGYLSKVIGASAQLATAWSEIARRYQNLGRSDLARSVIERAYVRTRSESTLVAGLMRDFADAISPARIDGTLVEIERAQRRYRVALLGMQDRYDAIDERLNPFGFQADYVPFLALDEDDVNAVEPMFERAKERAAEAARAEAVARESALSFNREASDFQNQLVGVRTEYEKRLGELCGTFVGEDGRVYPAVARYAHLSEELSVRDDPCGGTETGELWRKVQDIQTRQLELQRVRTEIANTLERARLAQQSVAAQCALVAEDVTLFLETQGALNGYRDTIDGLRFTIRQADKILDYFTTTLDFIDNIDDAKTLAEVVDAVVATIVYGIAATVHFAATISLEAVVLDRQIQIRNLEEDYRAQQIARQCDYLTADLAFTLREIHLDLATLELDVLEAIWNLQVEIQLLAQLDNQKRRLVAEWDEVRETIIDAAAAASDPNVRIYRNDAIINADLAFERALRDAYRATKIYEYYTSQSYAAREQLYLVRLAEVGEFNLFGYLAELEDAFFEFEEQFGNPDSRIQVISLRDDVLRVPRFGEDGRTLTLEERVEIFRERLRDPSLLGPEGFISVPFSTRLDDLSPLTFNHKVLFIEAELFGADVGDDVARLYVRQQGTGVIRTTDGGRSFFAFPPRTAVINPVVNGERSFGQDSDGAITGPARTIFRNYRFRDRPVVNTGWELVINRRTEAVNRDLNLGGIDDIVLSIYYTDFTSLEN